MRLQYLQAEHHRLQMSAQAGQPISNPQQQQAQQSQQQQQQANQQPPGMTPMSNASSGMPMSQQVGPF